MLAREPWSARKFADDGSYTIIKFRPKVAWITPNYVRELPSVEVDAL